MSKLKKNKQKKINSIVKLKRDKNIKKSKKGELKLNKKAIHYKLRLKDEIKNKKYIKRSKKQSKIQTINIILKTPIHD